MERQLADSIDDFERLAAEASRAKYVLRLYVSGMTGRSHGTLDRLKVLCEEHLQGHYELEVIDIYLQPARAQEDEIVVTPTLIKKLPLPLRHLVGNLLNADKVLQGL